MFRNLTLTRRSPRFVDEVVNDDSALIGVDGRRYRASARGHRPDVTTPRRASAIPIRRHGFPQPRDEPAARPSDGCRRTRERSTAACKALERIAPLHLQHPVHPGAANLAQSTMLNVIVQDTETFCQDKRAFLIVDIPATSTRIDEHEPRG